MFAGVSLVITNLAITRARMKAASICDICCSEANRARSTCNLLEMLESSVKNAVVSS